ncbi:MAG: hypothetical protein AAGA03_18580, partial [Planctomycetota bacterium]
DRAGAHMAWASLCERTGRFRAAIDAYRTAIRLEPTMSGPRTNLAALLDNLGSQQQGPSAIQWMEEAKKLRRAELPFLARDAKLVPDNAEVQYRYGLALYLNGDSEEALERLVKASQLAPDFEDAALAVKLLREKLAE